jgi:AcrR family transcriptional regulator
MASYLVLSRSQTHLSSGTGILASKGLTSLEDEINLAVMLEGGRMAAGKKTKERILTEGADLLSRDGLTGVTLGVLAQQTGMSKSGLFAHFRSKGEVQLELLDETARIAMTSYLGSALQSKPGIARLRAVVDGWFGWTERAGLSGGCPVAAGMFELDDAPEADPVRQHLLRMEERWRSLLTQLVKEAIETGELKRDLDAVQFVWELCGIYLNHHASRRFIRDPQALHRANRAFASLLERSSTTSPSKHTHAPSRRSTERLKRIKK